MIDTKATTMPNRIWTLLAAGILNACAAMPDAPEALRPPAGQELVAKLLASGVQIYDCAASAKGGYEWKFRAPEASLRDASGKPMGVHYAGPTWRALDGSTVVGEVVARAPAKDGTSIPQLLLAARRGDGDGSFSRVASVQRLATAGGQAPAASGCSSAADVARVAKVPYTATYYFYQPRGAGAY